MELELTLPEKVSRSESVTFALRAVDAPLAGTTATWAMDVRQEDLPRPIPGAPCKILGFWNDIPSDERRDVVELMPPSYGRTKRYVKDEPMVIDVREMAGVIIGLYLLLALLHLVVMILRM